MTSEQLQQGGPDLKSDDKRQKKPLPEIYRELSPFFNFAYSLLASVLIAYYLGGWIDDKLDSAPWGMLALLLLILTSSFYSFLRSALKSPEKGAK